MFMSIEQLEQILIDKFGCDKIRANQTANLIADFDDKVRGQQ